MIKKINKVLSVCFALALLATATVTGTLAYNTRAATTAVADTTEEIDVELLQQRRSYDVNGNVTGLESFEDGKVLVPLVGSAQYNGKNFDRYGMPTAEGYVDQIVRVQNVGTGAAYVRVVVAIPAALDDADAAGNNALHWNLGNRFMPDGDFSAGNNTNQAFDDVTWKFVQTAEVNGVESNLYCFTYKTPLAAGEITEAAAFVGFYLDSRVDVVNGRVLLDGVDTGFADTEVKIPVKAQAVQAYGFAYAEDAFANVPCYPWKNETK